MGNRRRSVRRRVMCLVKHRIADLNIAFYVRQDLGDGIVVVHLGYPDFAEEAAPTINNQLAVGDKAGRNADVQDDKVPGAIDKSDFTTDARHLVAGLLAV